MAKQIVRYDPERSFKTILVGKSARVFPLDHPSDFVSNTMVTTTSGVLKYDRKTGEFETLNSIYIPI